MAITKEQIFQAADALAADGVSPTLANVRKALGGGSFTTISEAMGEWKGRQQSSAAPIREPAPEAVSRRIMEVGAELWAVAMEAASSRMAGEREALESARVAMAREKQETAALADQLSEELEKLTHDNAVLLAEIEGLKDELKRKGESINKLNIICAQEKNSVLHLKEQNMDLKDELKKEKEKADECLKNMVGWQMKVMTTEQMLEKLQSAGVAVQSKKALPSSARPKKCNHLAEATGAIGAGAGEDVPSLPEGGGVSSQNAKVENSPARSS